MSGNPELQPRNPAHHKALGLEDLTDGREVTVFHQRSGEVKHYVVASGPYLAYDCGRLTPSGNWDRQELHVNLRTQSGTAIATATAGMGVTRYENEGALYWNAYYITIDSSDEMTLSVDPVKRRAWLRQQELRRKQQNEMNDSRRHVYRELSAPDHYLHLR